MGKGRIRGCPVNIKDWLIYAKDVVAPDSTYVLVDGLTSMNYSVDSETEDGSLDTDIWREDYTTKRSASLSLEGRRIVSEATGAEDDGQALLNDYARATGCEADVTLKIIDPFGHAFTADFIVNSTEVSQDDANETVSWDLTQVGSAEPDKYVHVQKVYVEDLKGKKLAESYADGEFPPIITLESFSPASFPYGPIVRRVTFNPDFASYPKVRIRSRNKSVGISNIEYHYGVEDGKTYVQFDMTLLNDDNPMGYIDVSAVDAGAGANIKLVYQFTIDKA